jgi:hypothetical protein
MAIGAMDAHMGDAVLIPEIELLLSSATPREGSLIEKQHPRVC